MPVVDDSTESSFRVPHSAFRAFTVLIIHSFQRHWRVRQMGWAALGLLGVAVVVVAGATARPGGWSWEGQRAPRTKMTNREVAEQLLPDNRYRYYNPEDPVYKAPPTRPLAPVEVPAPLDPSRDNLQSLFLSIPSAVMANERLMRDWATMNFSWWIVLLLYLGFVMPLFTLTYASGAFGAEREDRTLLWLMTRPVPRSAIYLAKFLGTLPWCLLFSGGGFIVLCCAGGEHGRIALGLYWPAALAGTIALAALFHLIGALFRWPVVIGLVYVFFFEGLVALLPGSLKLLSLTFYARCLMYNGAVAAGYPAELLEVSQPVSSQTAWAVLTAATFGITGFGMWWFARAETRDDA